MPNEQASRQTTPPVPAYGCSACETGYDTAADAARCCPGCQGQRGGPPAQHQSTDLDALIAELGLEAEAAQARAELAALTPEEKRDLIREVFVPITAIVLEVGK